MTRTRSRRVASLVAMVCLLAVLLPGDSRAAAPTNRRVSVANDGSQAAGTSGSSVVTPNGRFVAFISDAANLVSGDTNGVTDTFVRDRLMGTTERVSVGPAGAQGDMASTTGLAISADGRYVAFTSDATNLVASDTNGVGDVFVRDRTNGATERASVASGGTQATGGPSIALAMSADGRYVSFSSKATNLVANDTNTDDDAFVRDRTNGTTERVSLTSAGGQIADVSAGGGISDDGRFVAFSAASDGVVSGDTNGVVDVFLRDRTNATTQRISEAANGTQGDAAALATNIPVSSDGRYVGFASAATNMLGAGNDTNGATDVFRKDRVSGAVLRVSQKSDGTAGNGLSTNPVLSPDGRFIGFQSLATNLTASGDTLGHMDVFVHDAITRETVRVSEGSEANGASSFGRLSAASEAVFTSAATNLVSGDTNGTSDIFARHFRRGSGYFILDDKGGIFTFGTAAFKGSVPGLRQSGVNVGPAAIVDLEVTPSGNGYYVLDDKGGVFTFGDAPYHGSVPELRASNPSIGNAPVLDIAVTPSGQGYVVLDRAGGIFTFGDATFHGSIPQLIASGVNTGGAAGVDLALTPTGKGYFILDDKGGIFSFGDAVFRGSVPGLKGGGVPIGDAPAIRMAVTPSGGGYIVLDQVGGMFTFGDAEFFGSIPGLRASGVQIGPADGVDLAVTPTGKGYQILDDVGGIFSFGDAEFFGSVPGLRQAGQSIGPNTSIRFDLASSMSGG